MHIEKQRSTSESSDTDPDITETSQTPWIKRFKKI